MTLIKSPLPGKIVEYKVKRGDKVFKGDVVIIIESMKMHNEICAESNGVVNRLIVFPNQIVSANDNLLEMK